MWMGRWGMSGKLKMVVVDGVGEEDQKKAFGCWFDWVVVVLCLCCCVVICNVRWTR